MKTSQHEAAPDEVTTGRRIRTGAPAVGIGLWIATIFSIRYKSNTMR
jgi:hypothetical protein